MHANAPRNLPKAWHEKLARSGYFVGALLLHLIIFLLLATWVIWKAPPPPASSDFHSIAVQIAPPPPPPAPSSGSAAANPQFEPTPVVVPVVTPLAMITNPNTSAFTMDAPKVLDQTLAQLTDQMAQGSGLGPTGGGVTIGTGSAFGSANGSSTELSGYLYDLKQTGSKTPTGMTEGDYLSLLAKYVAQGWDDSLLAPYYKSKSPLYTSVYAISTRGSGEGPKAFGLEKEVQPGLWVIHYHAKVEAPEPGEYRLAGFADNVMVVKINGETVLDGGWDSLSSKDNLHQTLPFIFPSYIQYALSGVHNPKLKIGPAFRMGAAEPVDLDILIGDCGGFCSYFLLIEKEGERYQPSDDGTPQLPFFQLGKAPPPTFSDGEEHPPYSSKAEPWQTAE